MPKLIAALALSVCCQFAHAGDIKEQSVKLDEAARAWRKTAPHDYTFTVRYSAMVGMLGSWEQTFKVRGNRSVPVCSGDCDYREDKFGSVPILFRFGQHLLGERYDDANVEIDQTYGFPKKVYVGNKTLEDAYFSFEVVEFNTD